MGTDENGLVYWTASVIQVVAVVNGTAGCVRYSTRLMNDTGTAGHLGPLGGLPSALLVLAAAFIFWFTGSHTGLLSIFAAMNTVTHGFSAYALLCFAYSRNSGWDGMLACVCLLLVFVVVLAVFIIDDAPGLFALAVAGGTCLITLLPAGNVPRQHQE